MDNRLISKIRVILAFSALAVIYLDPSEPQRFVELTYLTLIFYGFYSLLLVFFSFRKPTLIPLRIAHWIDVVWYLILISFSSGTNSIFFFLFFFPIQTASFRFGFSEGLRVTSISVALFVAVGYLTAPSAEGFELNRFLIRIISLGVLGYMIAYWGGEEFTNKRRLAVLKDISKLYNPRFGIDQTISSIMQKINGFFDSDSCVLISVDESSSGFLLRRSYRTDPEHAIFAEPIKKESPLLTLAGENALIYNFTQNSFWNSANFFVFDTASGERIEAPSRNGEVLADLLETRSFIGVAVYQREIFTGRLYLTSQKKAFNNSDLEFLKQLLDQAVPVVENVNLLDRLASQATEQQRQKISRDIHDSTIQPYIGIKLGLEALQMRQAAGADIKKGIDQLVKMANTNIADLRSYITKLKEDKVEAERGAVLVSAIRQQAGKISEFYGINIEVFAENDIRVNDRLSAEIFQIVTEGLSNVRRHTDAGSAVITIKCDGKMLKLDIENNRRNGLRADYFIPKSIDGRVIALGGKTSVENKAKRTKVSVEIPL